MSKYLFLLCITLFLLKAHAQCDVKNKLWPDQTMYYYMDPELFFYTQVKSLKGNITTDKNNYFLRLLPKPFPDKESKKELDHAIKIELSNDSSFILENFDFQYRSKDTSLSLMYLIPKDLVPVFLKHTVKSLTIDLGDESGPRNYVFVLHKATLREQLSCLMDLK